LSPEDDLSKLHRTHDADMHRVERRLDQLERDRDDLCKELLHVEERMTAASDHLRWTEQSRKDLQEVIDGKRWASHTRHVIGWVTGAVLGALMLWGQIGPWVRDVIARDP